jgi:hypothetical protein
MYVCNGVRSCMSILAASRARTGTHPLEHGFPGEHPGVTSSLTVYLAQEGVHAANTPVGGRA